MSVGNKKIQKDFSPLPTSFMDTLILKVQVALINARTPHRIDIPFPLFASVFFFGELFHFTFLLGPSLPS
ncbi:MAG: hypothetical protein ACXAD7_15800 [Candidatus Kariarchaeaceae archaeon]